MAIENPDLVDAVGIDKTTGEVVLTVADALDWNESESQHLQMLQEKLNRYLRFVESGELLGAYSDAKGRIPVISVVARYEPSPAGVEFLAEASQRIEAAGFRFSFQ